MRQPLTPEATPKLEPAVAWPGVFTAATAASVYDEVVVGAIAGDGTVLLGAPFGYGEYRELAILGGRVGDAPAIIAGNQMLTPNLAYSGMYVNAFDDRWQVHTPELAVLSAHGSELAAAVVGSESLVAWSTPDACYLERILGPANGVGGSVPGACHAPRLASTGNDVALVFERVDGVYFAHGAIDGLSPTRAALIAPGGSEPHVVASADSYWVDYRDQSGAVVAGVIGADGTLRATQVAPAATAHELAVVGGMPRAFTADQQGLTVAALCTE
jgi:hypothetical protein